MLYEVLTSVKIQNDQQLGYCVTNIYYEGLHGVSIANVYWAHRSSLLPLK